MVPLAHRKAFEIASNGGVGVLFNCSSSLGLVEANPGVGREDSRALARLFNEEIVSSHLGFV
jgi:hypothetical protein